MATLTNRTIRSTYDQLIHLEDLQFQDGFGTSSLSGSYELIGDQNITGSLHMSGNFYFSLIPINWTKLPEGKELPFGCIINKVEFLDDIIEEFVNDPYKGVIPISSLVDVDPLEKDDEENVENTHVRNIWSIIL